METGEKKGLTREEAAAFIGKNEDFYLEKWKAHSGTRLKGWNWAAMFFGIEWMAYRRMYLEAAITYLLSFLIMFALAFLPFDQSGELIGYGLRILFGVFGNMLYRNKALRVLRDAGGGEGERLLALSRKGGVRVSAVFVLLLLEAALSLLFHVL